MYFFLSYLLLFFQSFLLVGNDLFDKIYGHSLSRDKSLSFDISGKQIAIEEILEPSFKNEGSQKPNFCG